MGNVVLQIFVAGGRKAQLGIKALQPRLGTDANGATGPMAQLVRPSPINARPSPVPRTSGAVTTRPIEGSSYLTPGSTMRK
jgi:hypothetical protein